MSSSFFKSVDISPPAPKRRRLGETILETALNAALIGTAVGLTAFRLWRDRGKASEPDAQPVPVKSEPPPPPYEPRYAPVPAPVPVPVPEEPSRAPSPTPTSSESGRSGVSRKPTRPIRVSPRKKPTARPIRGLSARASTQTLRSSAFDRELSHKRSNMSMAEPQASDADDDEGGDDQMDWMTSRLQGLIEQGKRALDKEVVVMDDTTVDQEQGVEDDGSRDWEDDAVQPPALTRAHSYASLAPSAPSLSRSVSQRDLHAPIASPYKLPALQRSTTSLSSASVSRPSGSGSRTMPARSAAAPPSSWSASRARSATTVAAAAAASIPTSAPLPTPSFDAPTPSAPMQMPRRMTSATPLRRAQTDEDRFWQDTKTNMPGPSASTDDLSLLSASPEMRHFMEQARRARLGL